MKEKKKRVTIKDVAALAGVSPTTVSFVLNDVDVSIPDCTKAQVRKAAEELEYQTDFLARAMVTRKTNLIGVIIPDLTNAFFAEVVRDMQVEFAKYGYDILLCNSEESALNDFRYLKLLTERSVDGLVIAPSAQSFEKKNKEKLFSVLQSSEVPHLFFDRYFAESTSVVAVDNLESSYRAANYLLDNGHKKIGTVVGPLSLNSSSNRLLGLRKAMGERGLSLPEEYIYEGKYDYQTGVQGGDVLIRKGISAIFAFSDMQAYGVYESAKRLNKHIPKDLSVIGFDDVFYSTLLETPLTTMRQPIRQIACEICRVMLSLIEKSGVEYRVFLPSELILRDSVKNFNKT